MMISRKSDLAAKCEELVRVLIQECRDAGRYICTLSLLFADS